ncbi:hypothetical protein R5R35_005118 [Gryllus longicercus]|uniref:Alanine--glyoxylate aminotransferase 2, mitochondrial n=1 Tax=Gryllus longicercus TaxID=2509291 RepID=A0AAN9VAE2_9ORTH
MFHFFRELIAGLPGKNVIRQLSSQSRPSIPKCSFKAQKYKGPSFEMIRGTLKKKLFPSVTPYYKTPLLIHEGKMQWLFDHNGKRYLDMFGGIVTVSVGHCHPKVISALEEQMNNLWHTTSIYMHPMIYEYADALTSKLPENLKVVYFVNSGSEATDLAILLARLYSKNYDIISLRNSYHGMSFGAMGVTALSTWKHPSPAGPGIHHAMNPDVYRGIWGGSHCRDSPSQTDRHCSCESGQCDASVKYFDQVEEILKYSIPKGKVAGFIAESIQGVGGTVQFPKEYLKKVYNLIRSNGGVCIADEVQTGFGRTGDHFWGFEMHGVQPDIVTMAKGIGNGFPLAAVVTTPEIAQSLGQALHFNTFGGNPLASAVGLAVLNVMEEENTQLNSKNVGTYLIDKLQKLRKYECVGDIRGKGLMIGVEMVNNKETREPLSREYFQAIWENCKDMGLLLGAGGLHGNVFRIKPPMCVNNNDINFTVEVFETAIESFVKGK